jgi:hypothetical protein
MPEHLSRSETSRIEALETRLAAAEARLAALEASRGAVLQFPVGGSSPPLGKDALCAYCGGQLWVCRGVHSVC